MNQPPLRILLVGFYKWPWYQEVCATSLERHGCEVVRFGWFDDFCCWREGRTEPTYHSWWHRIQYRLRTGPIVWRVFRRLIRVAKTANPDVIWFYNVQLVAPWVVKSLKDSLPNTTFVQYANDNPFSSLAKPGIWRNYLKSVRLFDVHFAYRSSNIEDYQRLGAKSVYLLRAYFIPEEDYPVSCETIPERFKCDVVFAGHYEDDGRVEMLEAICEAGYKLNLFGGGWKAAAARLRPDSPLKSMYPICPVTKDDYRFAISGAKVALCFLSTLNQDTYTRRCFQIPAIQVAMLSQYTDDLASLYEPNYEAVYFHHKHDLLDQLSKLIDDDCWRKSVAKAGFDKVYSSGHNVDSRMKDWLEAVQEHRSQSNHRSK